MSFRISTAVICVAMLTLMACDFGPPQVQPPGGGDGDDRSDAAAGPLAESLTSAQVVGILGCQQAIQYQGAQFTSIKESDLDECFDKTLAAQLSFENGQINSSQYNQELSSVRTDCRRQFQAIGAASTVLVNNIVSACTPVEDLILPESGYDPLQFGALVRDQNIDLVDDATGLAGRICGAKELFVDGLEDIQVPRMAGLLEVLDNGTGQFAVAGPTSSLLAVSTIPNIPLDSRCILPTLP